MASIFTSRLRFVKQGTGDNLNTWGFVLNESALEMIDDAIAGVASFPLSGSKTLTSLNGAPDEARKAFLNITGGTGGTITIPSVSKVYQVRNAATGSVIITTGGGSAATIPAGQYLTVMCDGANVYPSILSDYSGTVIKGVGAPVNATDAVNKTYADGILVSANAYTDSVAQQSGNLPGQGGFAGRLLTTDGTSASWATKATLGIVQTANNLSDLTDFNAARSNLGLANSATRAVGTTAGTVAAGDDSRITGAAQKASNLSDLASAASARTNLGLGTVAVENTVPVAKGGTGATTQSGARDNLGLGTAAVYDIGSFLLSSQNLNDLPSKVTALANLGFTGNVGASGTLRVPVSVSGSPVTIQLKWITQTITGTQSVTWPNGAFPNAFMAAIGGFSSSGASGDRIVKVYSGTTSGATVENAGASASVTIFAIGY